jgi:hypothetical protein
LGARLDGPENGLLPDYILGFSYWTFACGLAGHCAQKSGAYFRIITDNTLSKLGSLREFLDAMDPEDMARIIGEQVGLNLST